MDFSIIFPCLGKAKVSTANSNLTNLDNVQRLHENIKWIICVFDVVYTLLTKTFLLFHIFFVNMFHL